MEKKSTHEKASLLKGFLIGAGFGFLLQKGGASDYNVIIGQLLLEDFTVLKIMLSAAAFGMAGIYILTSRGKIKLHPKSGSPGSTVPGGLIFGAGFALLGYCPGTVAAAAGQGSLDALFAGAPGMVIGSAVFASLYPKLRAGLLDKHDFGKITIPELFPRGRGYVKAAAFVLILGILAWIEHAGF